MFSENKLVRKVDLKSFTLHILLSLLRNIDGKLLCKCKAIKESLLFVFGKRGKLVFISFRVETENIL
jgi:hypothetical protein